MTCEDYRDLLVAVGLEMEGSYTTFKPQRRQKAQRLCGSSRISQTICRGISAETGFESNVVPGSHNTHKRRGCVASRKRNPGLVRRNGKVLEFSALLGNVEAERLGLCALAAVFHNMYFTS